MGITKLDRSQMLDSGHTIIDSSNNILPPRANLVFSGAVVSDDVENDQTIITITADPIVDTVSHNNLSGLQGGTTNERYHLTESQVNSISDIINKPFAYNNVSPSLIFTAIANKQIYEIEINILVGFNGISPTLSIGDINNTERLVSINENLSSEIGQYIIRPSYIYTTNTEVNLYITTGAGSTSGSGVITIKI